MSIRGKITEDDPVTSNSNQAEIIASVQSSSITTSLKSNGPRSPNSRATSPKKSKAVIINVEYPIKPIVLQQCDEFDKWVKLRANCLEKLNTFTAAILAIDAKRRGEMCLNQMIFLIQMHRDIACKLVSLFVQFDICWNCKGKMEQTRNDMELYVINLTSSLDFLMVDPFISWIGVDMRSNPFALFTRIDGTAAEIPGLRLNDALNDPEIINECEDMGNIIYKYSTGQFKLSTREKRRKRTTEDRSDENDSGTELDDEAIEVGYKRVRELILGRWVRSWKKAIILEQKCNNYRVSIHLRNKRLIFERFQFNVWSSGNYRRMQQKAMKKRIMRIMTAWKEYTIWCHRLGEVRRRALLLHCKQYVNLWRRLTRDDHQVRTYWKHFRHHRMNWLFRALRNNRLLNKYLLKCRIKTLTTLTFKERECRKFCFLRWRTRCAIVIMLDRLEFRSESNHIRLAFDRWKENTADPTVPVTQHIKGMGQAVLTAVTTAAKNALAEARASRNEGYTRVRTAANVIFGRTNAENLMHNAYQIDEAVHKAATTAIHTMEHTVHQANVLSSSVKVYVAKNQALKKIMKSLPIQHLPLPGIHTNEDVNSATGAEAEQPEDPILELLNQRKHQLQVEQTRKSRMLHALMYARLQQPSGKEAVEEDGDGNIQSSQTKSSVRDFVKNPPDDFSLKVQNEEK